MEVKQFQIHGNGVDDDAAGLEALLDILRADPKAMDTLVVLAPGLYHYSDG